MQSILALYPTASSSADGVSGTLFYPSESREKDEDAVLKIDQKINSKNNLSARYIYNWYHDPNSGHSDFLPGGVGAVAAFDKAQGLSVALVTNPTSTLVNQLRLSANRTNQGYTCAGVGLFNSFGYIDQVDGAPISACRFSPDPVNTTAALGLAASRWAIRMVKGASRGHISMGTRSLKWWASTP